MLDPLYNSIARFIVAIHELTKHVPGGSASGLSWALAIVLLTVAVRLLLFPLFVKQIHSQRKMQELQPKIKELQAKHKGDKGTLNTEMMKLYKEQGANPVAGCLPLLLQMPIFFSLFSVLRGFTPKPVASAAACVGGQFKEGYCFAASHGIDAVTVKEAGEAKVFGAPISSAFTSKQGMLEALDATSGTVKAVTLAFILFMGVTTFISQKQLMAKNGPVEGQAATQQKVLLYVMPVMLALFGLNVALGVLLYWTTTNLWSMGQQRIVISKMVAASAAAQSAEASKPPVSPTPPPGYKPRAASGQTTPSSNGDGATDDGAPVAEQSTTDAGRPRQAPPNRSKSTKKGQRRGGRR